MTHRSKRVVLGLIWASIVCVPCEKGAGKITIGVCFWQGSKLVDPLREFAKDSVRLVKRCHKPDRKEFTKVAFRTAIGFVVMGFVGFFVKLIFIPINNIIVGSS